jgi:K+-sensing histidine kinase KdpD
LAQQIPTLIERHLDRSQATEIVVGKPRTEVRLFQLALLVAQLPDQVQYVDIIHPSAPLDDQRPSNHE